MKFDEASNAAWHRKQQAKWQAGADNLKYSAQHRLIMQKTADGHRSCAERAERKIEQVTIATREG